MRAESLSFPCHQIAAAFLFAAAVVVLSPGPGRADDEVSLRAPEGFGVSLYADDDLAHDIFSMTFDSHGRPVVSGPGYVRILIDSDNDGKADQSKQFADGPSTGAQGMYFLGRDLMCVGDDGLLRYRDRNGDDRADGAPDVFLHIKASGEHHAHALQKGPDGWWYLIAGNNAEVSDTYVTLPLSPVQKPRAGTLLRLTPDLSRGEIVADGLRNSYDFAFHPQGDVFTYDSDDERDVSLPWYRPTRVFHVVPGSSAGWVSPGWKQPDYYFGMPPAVASFGRGSPTGVVCYRHRQFPAEYNHALFVLDWTFGRVMALPLEADGATWKTEPIPFLEAKGAFGFAPTDAAVGPDGSLYVCVGGRGTRGGVYRIRYEGPPQDTGQQAPQATPAEANVLACLDAGDPLSSWSRAVWLPLAEDLGREPFVAQAINEDAPTERRVRAIEILTEIFGGLDDKSHERLARSNTPEVRARAAWSLGRDLADWFRLQPLLRHADDRDPRVARAAFESLLYLPAKTDVTELLPILARKLGDADRGVRGAAARVASRLPAEEFDKLVPLARAAGDRALVMAYAGLLERPTAVHLEAVGIATDVLEYSQDAEIRLEAARLLQLALGDVGPGRAEAAVFDGYTSVQDLAPYERQLDDVRARLAKAFPTGDALLDIELSRLLAVLAPYSSAVLDALLGQITDESHPIDDVHRLIAAARIPVERTAAERNQTAAALLAIDRKIAERELAQDSHWGDRIDELYRKLAALDVRLTEALIQHGEFGRPGHVAFVATLDPKHIEDAAAAFVRDIEKNAESYSWTNEVILVLGESNRPENLELVRQQINNFAVQGAVLTVLARRPAERDREMLILGLDSPHIEILSACVGALGKIPPGEGGAEQIALLRTLRRLGHDEQEYALREDVMKLLERNAEQSFGFVYGPLGYLSQASAIENCSAWINARFPEEAAKAAENHAADFESLKPLLASVSWGTGSAERGRAVFEKRSCAQCHSGRSAIGPDLAGSATRFSRDDLFTAIADPSRDVSPRYQAVLIETVDGRVFSGMVVYEAVDGILLRNATNQTFRISPDEIGSRRSASTSLMPSGLLKDAGSKELADLYAYLQSLGDTAHKTGLTRAD
jgi:putative membrane-bound dehydrogenase-like protein